MICLGCSTSQVTPPEAPADQPALSGKSAGPINKAPCPRPEPQPGLSPETVRPHPVDKKRQTIIRTAITALGAPYRWGGLSPKGFDCSGLVVYAYKKLGIHVPRTAKAQFKSCTSVTRQNIKPADLVFFSVPRRRGIVHVGIYIGNGQFVHAPGRGRKVKRASLNNIYFKQHFIKAGNFFYKKAGKRFSTYKPS
ncbi:MAG: C40 family peptidase [Desulfobacterales bacterium]|nr:C40 family peptidase [Desulfobacterales bacterium]